jgi:polysaccharide biosynthesis protein PslH
MDPQPFESNIQDLNSYCQTISIYRYDDQPQTRRLDRYIKTRIPPHIDRLTLPTAIDKVREITESGDIDIVYGVFTSTGEYLKSIDRNKCKILLDVDNLETRLMQMGLRSERNPFSWFKTYMIYRLMKNYEINLINNIDRVVAISQEEGKFVEKLVGTSYVTVIPPMIDTNAISAGDDEQDQNAICFLGSFQHQPNVEAIEWFCWNVLPKIIGKAPEAHLFILGSDAYRLERLSCGKNITLVGEVTDVQEWLRKCAVFISPIRSGGGARMKNLEALAAGCPLVTTSLGAEGLAFPAGTAYMIADKPFEFAECVIKLLGDPELRKRMGREGRQLVEEGHDTHVVGKQLNSLLETTLNG